MTCIERSNENEMNPRQKSWLGEACLTTATFRRRRCHCHAGCCGCFSTVIPVVMRQIRANSSSSGALSPFPERQKQSLVKNSSSGSFVLLLLLLLSGLVTSQDAPLGNETTAPTAAAVTVEPTLQPSGLVSPTSVPSLRSSDMPSAPPSISHVPSISPAPSESYQPSVAPSSSVQPTSLPSSMLPRLNFGNYRQEYIIQENSTFFNDTEKVEVESLFASYTDEFVVEGDQGFINTTCTVTDQKIFIDPGVDGQPARGTILTLEYRCGYFSRYVETSQYPGLFVQYVNANLPKVTNDVQNISPTVMQALSVVEFVASTPAPTFSMIPSAAPSPPPTISQMPSDMPSDIPTNVPTAEKAPTLQPSMSAQPTGYPTFSPPPPAPNNDSNAPLIAGLVVALGLAGLAGLFVFYRRSKQDRGTRVTGTSGAVSEGMRRPSSVIRSMRAGVNYGGDTMADAGVVILPSDSLVSNKSYLSAGDDGIGDDSGDEVDGTKNLQDEFDQYKDQTLEQFRSNIEGNLTGFEGIMSAAVTKALMGDDDDNVDEREVLWGSEPGANGAEIEASALCEVSDWIKRNETAPSERKRVFMKEVLNRMVTSVRLGVLPANDGSRTIHECAALLGLPLKNELPMTTVIISGMRKTVGANEMMRVLREFGEIDVCAVASGQRGFGIVRFRNAKSVDRAMRRYRGGEIVVQDVAIQMKVLNPSGSVDS